MCPQARTVTPALLLARQDDVALGDEFFLREPLHLYFPLPPGLRATARLPSDATRFRDMALDAPSLVVPHPYSLPAPPAGTDRTGPTPVTPQANLPQPLLSLAISHFPSPQSTRAAITLQGGVGDHRSRLGEARKIPDSLEPPPWGRRSRRIVQLIIVR